MIESISISNYKSFGGDGPPLQLNPFSVFIGPNAAGKTNLIDAFRFIQKSIPEGIGIAAGRQLGWHGIRCQKKRSQIVFFALTGNVSQDSQEIGFAPPSFQYLFSFRHEKTDEYTVIDERAEIWSRRLDSAPDAEREKISFFNRTEAEVSLPVRLGSEWQEEPRIPIEPIDRGRLFVGSRFYSQASSVVSEEIMRWQFYDPDLEAARRSSMMMKPVFMSPDGNNLALVLHELKKRASSEEDSEEYYSRAQLRDIMQTMVPDFEDWETERLADGRITFKVKEKHLRSALRPELVSDGTIRLLVTLAALLYPQKPFVAFIEEPERNLHPLVMEQLVDFMREVSRQTQIIVTTHSADFVRYCRPEEVFLMDKIDGLTQVERAVNIEHIEEFLKRFMLDELWLQGYLEAGIPL